MIFAELFCGSAAVSLALRQARAKPPVSYQGAKTGYAEAILAAFGLFPGQGCQGLYLADVGPWAAVWAGLAGSSLVSPEEVASWLVAQRWSFSGRGPERGYGGPGCAVNTDRATWTTEDRDRALSIEHLQRSLSTLPVPPDPLKPLLEALEGFQNEIDSGRESPKSLWYRLRRQGWPGLVSSEPRLLAGSDSGELARFLACLAMSMVKNGACKGYSSVNGEGREFTTKAGEPGLWLPSDPESVSVRLHALPSLPPVVVWQGPASLAPLPEDLSDWIIYLDPPYAGTAGYSHGGISREGMIELALQLGERGAFVGISEAEDLSVSLPGWRCINVSDSRKGVKRAWSKQKDEYLTLSRAPVVVPSTQGRLF